MMKIKELRLQQGISIEKLAKGLEISINQYLYYEDHLEDMELKQFLLLSKMLFFRVSDFF